MKHHDALGKNAQSRRTVVKVVAVAVVGAIGTSYWQDYFVTVGSIGSAT